MSGAMARIEALHREIETARRELVALLKEEARQLVPDAVLQGRDGPVKLSELFGTQDELIVSFNMGKHCAYCTMWADEANGVLRHLETRAAFVVVSPDTVEEQAAFAASRGWRLRMASHRETSFAQDMGFAGKSEGGSLSYWPGFATFRKTEAGIERVGMSFYGPGDPYCSVFHFFALLESGGEGFMLS